MHLDIECKFLARNNIHGLPRGISVRAIEGSAGYLRDRAIRRYIR